MEVFIILEMKTFRERLFGLMFLRKIPLKLFLFNNCRSIHTCFMRSRINVYGIDKNYNVVEVFYDLKPYRFIFFSKGVNHVVETNNDYKQFKLGEQINRYIVK